MNDLTNTKKVLLLSLPFSSKGAGIGPKMENQGLCYLSAYLKSHNLGVDLFDANACETSWQEYINTIDFNNYSLIGFSVYSTNYSITTKILKAIRASGYMGHITMGGHYPTFSWEIISKTNPSLDSIVIGEGEKTLYKLTMAVIKSKDWKKISGIAFRKHDSIKINPPPPVINPLKFKILPDRTFYNDLLRKQNFATISSSRGCWGNCSFCSVRSFYKLSSGPCWRPREVKEIVDEIESLNKETDVNSFVFSDDNFIGPGEAGKERAMRIADEIKRRNLKISFSIDCRPDDIDEKTLNYLLKSGLVKVNIGIESFVERQQNLYSKKLSPEKIEKAMNILTEMKLLIAIYSIFFDPCVTFDELLFNFKKALEIGPKHFPEFITFLQVFPGIPIFEEMKKQSLLDSSKVLEENQNQYWINYKFSNFGIKEFFIKALDFEITSEHLTSNLRKKIPLSEETKLLNFHNSIKEISCKCYIEAIEKIKALKEINDISNILEHHFQEWKEKRMKIYRIY